MSSIHFLSLDIFCQYVSHGHKTRAEIGQWNSLVKSRGSAPDLSALAVQTTCPAGWSYQRSTSSSVHAHPNLHIPEKRKTPDPAKIHSRSPQILAQAGKTWPTNINSWLNLQIQPSTRVPDKSWMREARKSKHYASKWWGVRGWGGSY